MIYNIQSGKMKIRKQSFILNYICSREWISRSYYYLVYKTLMTENYFRKKQNKEREIKHLNDTLADFYIIEIYAYRHVYKI